MKEILTRDETGKVTAVTKIVESRIDPNLYVLLIIKVRPDGLESIVFGKVFKP